MSGEPLDLKTMTCADVDDRDLLADYVAGHLSDAERDALEAHVIGCDACAETLQMLLAAGQELAAERLPDVESAVSRPRRHRIVWPVLATAALLGIAVFVTTRREPPPAMTVAATPTPPSATPAHGASRPPTPALDPALMQLARVEPPPYTPFTVRSADQSAASFDAAMTAYTAGDFRRAADGLLHVVAADPVNTPARFYLGVSLMATGEAPRAAEQFRAVIAAGSSPFRESAQLFLAKSLIRQNDVDGAARELEEASRGSGRRAKEAADLLRQLRASRHS